jgi:hypothetical protein
VISLPSPQRDIHIYKVHCKIHSEISTRAFYVLSSYNGHKDNNVALIFTGLLEVTTVGTLLPCLLQSTAFFNKAIEHGRTKNYSLCVSP